MKNNKLLIGLLVFLVILFFVLLYMFLNKPIYEIQFVSDNIVIETVKVKRNNLLPRPADPSKDGYVFVNWYLDNSVYDFNSKVTSNMILTAIWDIALDEVEENSFIITFNTDGGNIISPIKIEENGKLERPNDPEREGYKFLGWYYMVDDTEKEFDFDNTVITNNVTIYAKWEKIVEKASSQSRNNNQITYTVTFNSNGGTSVATQTIKANGVAKRPTNPTKEGYVFVEWRLNNKTYDFNSKVTKDITLSAIWQESQPSSSSSAIINVTSVVLSKSSLNLTEGASQRLTATVNPINATNKDVTWRSSNVQVATVDSSGNVTAVGAGSATITATAGGKSATCEVTVQERITYSLEWVKIQESAIGEYMLYIKSSKGLHVSGTVNVCLIDFNECRSYDISINGHKFIRSAIDESQTAILSID